MSREPWICGPSCVHLDLELHAGIGQAAYEHRRGWADVAEAAAQGGPARLEVLTVGQQVSDPDDIGERAAGFSQCRFDVAQALLGLLDHVVGDGHGRIVEPGRPRHVYPVAVDHRPCVPDLLFEGGTAQDRASLCHAADGR
jgi:hypothetical protein